MIGLSPSQLDVVFPYHIIVDTKFNIIQAGSKLESFLQKDENNISILRKSRIFDLFDISSPPRCTWEWKRILLGKSSTFCLDIKSSDLLTRKGMKTLKLRGGILVMDPQQDPTYTTFGVIFLVNPHINRMDELKSDGFTFNDLSKYIMQREMMLVVEHLRSEQNTSYKLELERTNSRIRKLEEEKIKTQRVLETKRAFVRYISHEIRTPLNVMVMGLKLLQDNYTHILTSSTFSTLHSPSSSSSSSSSSPSPSFSSIYNTIRNQLYEDQELVCDMIHAGEISVEILNDLLLYEKIEGKLLRMEIDEVYIHDVIENVIKLFKVQSKAMDIHLKSDISLAQALYCKVDISKYSIALRNLLSNALKFTPQNGQVTVTAQPIEIISDQYNILNTPLTRKMSSIDYFEMIQNVQMITNHHNLLSSLDTSQHQKEYKEHKESAQGSLHVSNESSYSNASTISQPLSIKASGGGGGGNISNSSSYHHSQFPFTTTSISSFDITTTGINHINNSSSSPSQYIHKTSSNSLIKDYDIFPIISRFMDCEDNNSVLNDELSLGNISHMKRNNDDDPMNRSNHILTHRSRNISGASNTTNTSISQPTKSDGKNTHRTEASHSSSHLTGSSLTDDRITLDKIDHQNTGDSSHMSPLSNVDKDYHRRSDIQNINKDNHSPDRSLGERKELYGVTSPHSVSKHQEHVAALLSASDSEKSHALTVPNIIITHHTTNTSATTTTTNNNNHTHYTSTSSSSSHHPIHHETIDTSIFQDINSSPIGNTTTTTPKSININTFNNQQSNIMNIDNQDLTNRTYTSINDETKLGEPTHSMTSLNLYHHNHTLHTSSYSLNTATLASLSSGVSRTVSSRTQLSSLPRSPRSLRNSPGFNTITSSVTTATTNMMLPTASIHRNNILMNNNNNNNSNNSINKASDTKMNENLSNSRHGDTTSSEPSPNILPIPPNTTHSDPNTLQNSMKSKHSSSSNPVQRVLSLAPKSRKILRITVKDTGCGISKEEQKELFAEFVQIRPNKLQNGGGSGLGLWVARSIMEAHGGQIGVYSEGETGQGTTFYIDIPISKVDDDLDMNRFIRVTSSAYEEEYLKTLAEREGEGEGELTNRSILSIEEEEDDNENDKEEDENEEKNDRFDSTGNSIEVQLDDDNDNHDDDNDDNDDNDVEEQEKDTRLLVVDESNRSENTLISHSHKSSISQSITRTGDISADYVNSRNKAMSPQQENKNDIMKINIAKNDYVTSETSSITPSTSRRYIIQSLPLNLLKESKDGENEEEVLREHLEPTEQLDTPRKIQNVTKNILSSPRWSHRSSTKGLSPRCHNFTTRVIQSILIVDDSVSTRKMLTRVLMNKIPHIDEAYDGQHAILKYKQYIQGHPIHIPYDVIMMDSIMPRMNGVDATKVLRELGYEGLIVGATGNSLNSDIDEFLSAGVNRVMIKPINIQEFFNYATAWMQSVIGKTLLKTDSQYII